MINKNIKYSLKDIAIVPAAISEISSRSECNPYKGDFLPLFTAPMSSVVDLTNYKLFKENKIQPIIPRNIDLEIRKEMCVETWCAFSMKEFEDLFCDGEIIDNQKRYVLIDVANGSMSILHDSIRFVKEKHGDKLIIMAGNVANPETYVALSETGVDYVRCSVGAGYGCITASNTGIFYPSASLISECFEASCKLSNPAYIVADGGVRGYADIIKYLALNPVHKIIDQYSEVILRHFKESEKLYKTFYGMSTKKAQKELGNDNLKTSEGIERVQEVEYTMSQWVENFTDYLRSAMSYTNSKDLDDFIGEVQTIIISESAQNSINK